MHFRDDSDPHHFPPLGDDRHSFGHHRHGLVLFVGQYLEEPADTARHGQERAQGAHGAARKQSSKEQATPKARTSGHAVGAGNSTLAGVLVPCGFITCSHSCCPRQRSLFAHWFVHLPRMYTTVKTTTQTASTKCQYSDSTPTR